MAGHLCGAESVRRGSSPVSACLYPHITPRLVDHWSRRRGFWGRLDRHVGGAGDAKRRGDQESGDGDPAERCEFHDNPLRFRVPNCPDLELSEFTLASGGRGFYIRFSGRCYNRDTVTLSPFVQLFQYVVASCTRRRWTLHKLPAAFR